MNKHIKSPSKYLDSLNIKQFGNSQKFWLHMEKKHGLDTCENLENAFSSLFEGNSEDFYQAIYKDLAVSLDVASMRRNLYCDFLEYFVGVFPNFDGTLLDIGCGNGLLTCFYGLIYPTAKIIGIDKIESAVNCSRQLAEKLSLTNVEFLLIDCDSASWPIAEKSIDMAISMNGLEPSKVAVEDGTDGLFEWATRLDTNTQITAVKNLSLYTKLGGLFISVDRLATCETEILWLKGIQNAGFSIDLEGSSDFTFSDFGGTETLPIIVSRLDGKSASATELLAFVMARRGGLDSFTSGSGNDALAELLFASVNPKVIVAAWKAVYHNGSGTAHFEVWQSGVFVLQYTWTTEGYKDLKFSSLHLLRSTIKNIEDEMDLLNCSATVSKS